MQSAVSDYSNTLYNIVQDGGRIESDHRSGADFEKKMENKGVFLCRKGATKKGTWEIKFE